MKIHRLSFRHFRNLKDVEIFPGSGLNFFLGKNGQGKTSILEGIGYLSALRSFRGSATDEVIQFGEKNAEVVGDLALAERGDWKTKLRIFFQNLPTGRTLKTAFINEKIYRSSTQYLNQRFGQFELGFHSIVFNPSDHDLVRGEPALRRQYLDRMISAWDPEYFETLIRYQKLVEQRNALLKQDTIPSPALLDTFTDPLIEMGSRVFLKRLETLSELQNPLTEQVKRITPRDSFLRCIYLTSWGVKIAGLSIKNNELNPDHFSGQDPLPSLEQVKEIFRDRLGAALSTDLRMRSTTVGPHRDDWAFLFGKSEGAFQFLQGHGSQGEIRSSLLAFKLAEIDCFRKKTGHQPVLLLDDFSSELDQERRAYLLNSLNQTEMQVFVTSTELPREILNVLDLSGAKVFELNEGAANDRSKQPAYSSVHESDERLLSRQD